MNILYCGDGFSMFDTAKVIKASHNYNTYTITHLTAEGGASG